MAYTGPYQVYKIESSELVKRVDDWDKLAISVNNAAALAEGNAKAAAKADADVGFALDRGRLGAIEAKNTQQDGRLAAAESTLTALPTTYVPLSRGQVPDITDLNTFYTSAHVGSWGISSGNTYTNAPVFTSAGVLTIERGSGSALGLVQRITTGAVMFWREAIDATSGLWSAWSQAETVARADAVNATQNGRLAAVEAVNTAQDVRLEDLEAVALPPSNIALDADGIPYYSPGSTSVHVVPDADGQPYFITFMTASADADGTPYF